MAFRELLKENEMDWKISEIQEGFKIRYSMKNNFRCKILYNSGDSQYESPRIIAPLMLGLTIRNNPYLNVYQYSGDSKSGNPTGYKFIRADRIMRWENLKEHFMYSEFPAFNPGSNRIISKIFAIANTFGNSNNPIIKMYDEYILGGLDSDNGGNK